MKKLAILMMLIICSNSFSQKKELRQITKLVNEEFYKEALSSMDEIKNLVEISDDERLKATYFFNRAISERETGEFSNSINSYQSLINIDDSKYSTTIKLEIENLKLLIEQALVNSAVEDWNNQKHTLSMEKFYLAYDFNGNEDFLYNAAGAAVSSKISENYDNAIKYYLLLKNNGYTGIVDEYFITNNESGVEEKVSETQFDVLKGSKDYSNPRIGQTESRYPEIIKNIALLYAVQNNIDLAIEAIDEARKSQPDDISLIITEGDIYLNLMNNTQDEEMRKNYQLKFKEIMELAVSKDPENGLLYFNLGFALLENNEYDSAVEYFYKSIKFKPDNINSYRGILQIRSEESNKLNDRISDLLNAKKIDDKLIDDLKAQKTEIYNECVILAEKILEYDPENDSALKYLSQFYYLLDRLDDRKVIEAKCMEIYGTKCTQL